jgi:hypothetical protein
VRCRPGISIPTLSGVGFINEDEEFVAPSDPALSYLDRSVDLVYHPLKSDRDFVIFIMHDACWKLLLVRLSDDKVEKDWQVNVVRHLFDILYCTPQDSLGFFTPGHDYGGAGQFQVQVPRNLRHTPGSSLGYLASNPAELFNLDKAAAEPMSSSRDTEKRKTYPSKLRNCDVFTNLPVEIILDILTALPSSDVCTLRLASRYVAQITQSGFPQSFWASRFKKDFEMGFVTHEELSYDCNQRLDWHHLYHLAKEIGHDLVNARQRSNEAGFKNRRRIWRVLDALLEALRLLLANKHVYGLQPDNLDFKFWSSLDIDGKKAIHGHCISTNAHVRKIQEKFEVGTSRIRQRSLVWPQSCHTLQIAVSFVSQNFRSYVCGIRLHKLEADNDYEIADTCAVGYIIPCSEQIVSLRGDELKAIDMAVTLSGIVGLRFITQGLTEESSQVYTTGNFNTTTPDVGVGTILVQRGRILAAILVELDVCVPEIHYTKQTVLCD